MERGSLPVPTRILLASDGSPGALQAAQWLDRFADLTLMYVTVMTVIPASLGLGQIAYVVDPNIHTQLMDAVIAEAEEAARQTVDVMPRLHPPWFTQIAPNIVQAILDAAAEQAVDIIVVGRRGHGTWSSTLLGSVSLRLITHSPRPVWVIPPMASS
jgi:nucleotide-binding universal stress UspA family protein